jgi:hypothetical protein
MRRSIHALQNETFRSIFISLLWMSRFSSGLPLL